MEVCSSKSCRWEKTATVLFAVALATACGRSDMDPGEGPAGPFDANVSDAKAASADSGRGGQSGTATTASLGRGGDGGASPVSSYASGGVSSKGSRSTGSGGGGGASSLFSTISSKATGGASLQGGSGGAGGFSAGAGSKATSGSLGGTGGVSASAGSKSSGGSSGGTTSNPRCTDAKPCGGDVVGTWNVTSSCLTVTGQVDISNLNLGCQRAGIEGPLQVSGTWIANGSGLYSDKTITSGTLQLSVPASCLKVSGTVTTCKNLSLLITTLGFGSGMCLDAAGGGGCSCTIPVKQAGSMGVVSLNPWTSGLYEIKGNTLLVDGSNRYDYCVTGSQLTMTPQGTNPPTTGSVAFQKQ